VRPERCSGAVVSAAGCTWPGQFCIGSTLLAMPIFAGLIVILTRYMQERGEET